MSDALNEYNKRDERLREKVGQAIHYCRSYPAGAPLAVLDALRSFFGMLRDYGEMPRWRMQAKWEYDVTVLDLPTDIRRHLSKRGQDSWELSGIIRTDDQIQLVWKRMTV